MSYPSYGCVKRSGKRIARRRAAVFALAFAATTATTATAVPAASASQRLGGRVLRQGMTGGDVKTLQRDLSKLGFSTPADGDFGPMTKGNVERFERRYRLPVNGVVDRGFVRKLNAALARFSVTAAKSGGAAMATQRKSGAVKRTAGASDQLGDRTLHKGMSGNDVRQLQADLSALGYATAVDGQFGPSTKQSVVSYESAHGMSANGVVTPSEGQAIDSQATALDAVPAPPGKARLNSDGTVTAPSDAPLAVQEMIAAANKIAFKPYVYGGGHGSWNSSGYDCSGSVSFVLHGAGLLSSTEDSSALESYGKAGAGQWVTIWANAGHTYMEIAGLFYDTAAQSSSNGNDRWSTTRISPSSGYVVRHPTGL